MKIRLLVLSAMLALSGLSYGSEVYKNNVHVTYVGAMGDRITDSQYANHTVVGLTDLSWLPSVCSGTDGVIISSSNLPIIKVALMALETGKPVFARASNEKIGGYCKLTQLNVWANGSTINL
ncbi:MAG: hypothetical protein MI976_11300 [Pseudomonadales bacterium]|nr:hypothetical protein [Pseudomonadales bacterium]